EAPAVGPHDRMRLQEYVWNGADAAGRGAVRPANRTRQPVGVLDRVAGKSPGPFAHLRGREGVHGSDRGVGSLLGSRLPVCTLSAWLADGSCLPGERAGWSRIDICRPSLLVLA